MKNLLTRKVDGCIETAVRQELFAATTTVGRPSAAKRLPEPVRSAQG